MLDNILTKEELKKLVLNLVLHENFSYMEAIVHICKEKEIDPLDIGKLIDKTMKQKIEAEAMKLNMLPKGSNLKNFL